MIFGYESFLYIFKKNCDKKVLRAVYGNTKGPVISYVIVTFFLSVFFLFGFARIAMWLGFLLAVFCYVGLFAIIATRRMGLGLTEDGLVYLRLRLINQKPKEVVVIPFDNIRYLNVKKFIMTTHVTISFIGEDGKFRRIKLLYNALAIGFSTQQEMNGNFIREKLQEIQKVLDRGDF